MQRCLDCGAELTTELCENCGLSRAEAELVLRRRILYRTAIYFLGALAFLPPAHLYPPLELDPMLIFLGVISFFVLASAVWLDRCARRHSTVEPVKRAFYGMLPVPWLLAALLFMNGRFDSTPPAIYTTVVVGKFSMPGTLRSSRLVVHSWRPGVRIERVPISRDDYFRFQRGDPVEVRVQPGLVGIPWINAVYHK